MPRPPRGARARLRDHFLANLGRAIGQDELRAVAGGSSAWSRRLRELRDIDGFRLLSHRNHPSLKLGEYLLEDPLPRPRVTSRLSRGRRAAVLERDRYTCQMCGAVRGDIHHDDPAGRRARLLVLDLNKISVGASDVPGTLRVVCSLCADGMRMLGRARNNQRGYDADIPATR